MAESHDSDSNSATAAHVDWFALLGLAVGILVVAGLVWLFGPIDTPSQGQENDPASHEMNTP